MSLYMSNYNPWGSTVDTYDIPMMTEEEGDYTVTYPMQSGHRTARVWTGAEPPRAFDGEGVQCSGNFPQVGDLWINNTEVMIRVNGVWVELAS